MDDRTARQGPDSGQATGDVLLIAGNGRIWTHPLPNRQIVVGRDPACDVVVEDRALSRQHLRIELGPPLTVQDLGSTNGTKVSGRSVQGGPPIAIRAGESFHVGAYSFVVMAQSSASPSTQRSAHELMTVTDPTLSAATPLLTDIARSSLNVLILGESGVGKEVLAETVHALSGRTGPLQKINCAALSEQLLESELFGHEKGAFTGAVAARPGLLEVAEQGTVFLDEIGELPLSIQAKLLRAIEAREVLRLGATRPLHIDVRWVCATNRALRDEVEQKRFRHDLFFRIDGMSLHIPPLRERRGLIAALAARFADNARGLGAGSTGGLAPDVLTALQNYSWPGNVRELKAVIERAILLSRGRPLSVSHLAFTNAPPRSTTEPAKPGTPLGISDHDDDPADLDEQQRADRARVVAALDQCVGNQTRAAALLGISRTTLVTKLRVYRIRRPRA